MLLGYLACRKKLKWVFGGSVEGPELSLMCLELGAAAVREGLWQERELLLVLRDGKEETSWEAG